MDGQESEIIRAMKLSARELAWLCHELWDEGVVFDECQLNSQVMRRQIAQHLTREVREILEYAKDTQFLPDDDFRWIDKDGRMPSWLVRKVIKATGKLQLPELFATLPTRQQVIALIDAWEARLSDKKRTLSNLEHEWREHLQNDKLFSWFKEEDELSKCSMAWEWMEKNYPKHTRRSPPWRRHSELLDFFDRRDITSGEKELFVSKIKRRWSTQKSRENSPNKKQYNFVLTNDANSVLDKLAQAHKLSRTKILERLILNEAESGLHLGRVLREP